jgi:outer membrane lipoprotein-sorting protein
MFSGITDGYDVTLKKETADAWYFLCKKSKTNTDKDDPKSIDLVVAKGTYYPVSLKAKLSGVTMTLRDVSFGVTEQQVTFNPKDYPTATIVDKR